MCFCDNEKWNNGIFLWTQRSKEPLLHFVRHKTTCREEIEMSELFTLYFVKKLLTEPEFCRGLIKTASFLTDNASAILENRLADLRLSAELADIKTAAFQVAIEKKVLDIFTVYGVYWPE